MSIKWKSMGKKYVRGYQAKPEQGKNKVKQGATWRQPYYLQIKFTVNGTTYVSAAGWESKKITLAKVAKDAEFFHANAIEDRKPRTYKEQRNIEAIEMIKNGNGHKVVGMTFDELAQEWDSQLDEKRSGYAAEVSKYNYWIKPVCGHKSLHEVGPEDWIEIRANMEKGKSPAGPSNWDGQPRSKSTIKYCMDVFKRIWKYAIARYGKEFNLDKDRFASCKMPGMSRHKRETARARVLTDGELSLLLDALKERNQSAYHLAVMASELGARVAEIYKLTWKNYNPKANTILFDETKNGYSRIVKLTTTARACIESIPKRKPHDHIFLNSHGRPHKCTPKPYRETVKKLGFNDGVKKTKDKVVFHTLRHTLATKLAGQPGFDVRNLQDLFGWKDERMVLRYTHVDMQKQADALEAVSMERKAINTDNVIPLKKKA